MRKGIEWLKGLINEEGIVIDMNLLGRFDKQYWKNENIKINKGRLFYLIDQLDEPETLSEEWIENHTASADTISYYSDENVPVVTVEKLKNLLVPKQDKPVLPQFVADWIDAHNLHGNNPLREYRDLENDFNEGWTNEEDAAVYHWINKNPYAFIDALRYGCKVEKVKIYYIYDKSTKGYLGYNADKTRLSWYTSQFPNDVFTEQEIKSIDERYWAFAQEVTE